MSWLSKNYEKVALGGAALLAVGLAYMGWSKYSGVSEVFVFQPPNAGNAKPAVLDADLIPKTKQSMQLDRTCNQALDGERPVDLFVGIPLFIKSSEPDKPVDPITDAMIHPPIPNTWWIENRIDPGFADSPQRDPDNDGFSNLEEFNGKTDPNNAKSVPALIAKLKYVKDESLTWGLRPGYGSEGKFPLSYHEVVGRRWVDRNKMKAGAMVAPGEMFFPDGSAKNRFKLLGSEVRKEMNERIHAEVEVTIVRIEEQKPNKKGDIYELPSPLPDNRLNDFAQYDRTAVISLEALGLEGKEMKVEERTAFALPPTAAKKDYFLKKVTPDSITVEYPGADGQRKSVDIPKGSFPNMGE